RGSADPAQPAGVTVAAPTPRAGLAARLPAFPWDSLAQAKTTANGHPDGIVDLSVGTPVDPTPPSVQAALAAAADRPGYPTTVGTAELRTALVDFVRRHRAAPEQLDETGVLPTVGSKELVAHLPFQLGIGPGDVVAFPHIAYPTYDMGARFVGAQALPLDLAALAAHGDAALPDTAVIRRIRLLWLNSPSNPSGEVLDAALLPWIVSQVRSVCGTRLSGRELVCLLCVYSLSKQSNLAGYRAAFVAGAPALVGELLAVRKQAGMMLPGPIQTAMTVALGDDDAAAGQREIYRSRREVLEPALRAAGGEVHGSQAGLYLWTTFGEKALTTVDRLAGLGVLVAPGMFYGEDGGAFVRVALTATDERIAAAAQRLARY